MKRNTKTMGKVSNWATLRTLINKKGKKLHINSGKNVLLTRGIRKKDGRGGWKERRR